MAERRRFDNEFKVQVVREYLGGHVSRAVIARRYDIAADQVRAWQKQYEQGKLSEAPPDNGALHRRIAELERMVGRLALENDLLKKAAAWAARHSAEPSSEIVSGPTRSRSHGHAG